VRDLSKCYHFDKTYSHVVVKKKTFLASGLLLLDVYYRQTSVSSRKRLFASRKTASEEELCSTSYSTAEVEGGCFSYALFILFLDSFFLSSFLFVNISLSLSVVKIVSEIDIKARQLEKILDCHLNM